MFSSQVLKWALTFVGMGSLVVGLVVHNNMMDTGVFGVVHNILYAIGGFILIFPPLSELRLAKDEAGKWFPRLLVILETFLLYSALVFFIHFPSIEVKAVVRGLSSLIITVILKHCLGYLKEFRWHYLLPPWVFKYHWDSIRGKLGADCLMSLGIDWLGVGYAFLDTRFGNLALLVGSVFLALSAWRGFMNNRDRMALAWCLLNLVYVGFGIKFTYLAYSS